MQTKNIDPTAKAVRITYVRSAIGYEKSQKRTVQALGLRRLGDTVEQVNNPAIRGMIDSIGHLVEVEVVA
ncbi:MAG TPA: 50S ribosomal protein L30 [Anaerolineae bacterium]|nr:50S ribosomal protein L30 [Anaerolinea sp.]HNS02434.1 50S ribosomal protein L30 [Anaerolineae bacterium]HNU04026.1 50S ribosomal protein L30 [Anaerolineae bacterium]